MTDAEFLNVLLRFKRIELYLGSFGICYEPKIEMLGLRPRNLRKCDLSISELVKCTTHFDDTLNKDELEHDLGIMMDDLYFIENAEENNNENSK